jgi:hypothetical protein
MSLETTHEQTRSPFLATIAHELRHHVPFTAAGAASAIVVMTVLVLTETSSKLSEHFFHALHPAHVVLSALVTTALFRLHGGRRVWAIALVGYTGSVGIATLSDAIMPFWGATLLGIPIPLHVPFLEGEIMEGVGLPTWTLINGAAVVGILIGALWPRTRLPHAGHVLLSTYASLFYFTAYGAVGTHWLPRLPFIFVFLFLAVWVPCCMSDIVYPLLWTKGHGRCTEEHPCHRHRG